MSVLVSIMPGYTLAPAASTTFAPDGTATFAPTASILFGLITIVPFSITGPVTGKRRALVIAHVPPFALNFTSYRSGAGAGPAGRVCAAGESPLPLPLPAFGP